MTLSRIIGTFRVFFSKINDNQRVLAHQDKAKLFSSVMRVNTNCKLYINLSETLLFIKLKLLGGVRILFPLNIGRQPQEKRLGLSGAHKAKVSTLTLPSLVPYLFT
jgi:hypothetical protein